MNGSITLLKWIESWEFLNNYIL